MNRNDAILPKLCLADQKHAAVKFHVAAIKTKGFARSKSRAGE
jgi:hypothetical protein